MGHNNGLRYIVVFFWLDLSVLCCNLLLVLNAMRVAGQILIMYLIYIVCYRAVGRLLRGEWVRVKLQIIGRLFLSQTFHCYRKVITFQRNVCVYVGGGLTPLTPSIHGHVLRECKNFITRLIPEFCSLCPT